MKKLTLSIIALTMSAPAMAFQPGTVLGAPQFAANGVDHGHLHVGETSANRLSKNIVRARVIRDGRDPTVIRFVRQPHDGHDRGFNRICDSIGRAERHSEAN